MSSRARDVYCYVEGCGQSPYAIIHNRNRPEFLHAYKRRLHAGSRYGACKECGGKTWLIRHDPNSRSFEHLYASRRDEKVQRLCRSCTAGNHNGQKSEIGCIETVAPEPFDFVCSCATCRENPMGRTVGRRSDAEGVVRVAL